MNIKEIFFTKYPKQYGILLGLKEKFILPFKKILFSLGFNVFFGNKEQDKWVVEEVFNFKKNGFFVDLAATDGIHENNTFFLEKRLNWKGICIEPNTLFFKNLIKNRNTIFVNKAISSNKKKISFFFNGGIGGIIGKEFDNNFKKRKKLLDNPSKKKLIKIISSEKLYNVLKKNKAPKVIDYLSLDVEGAETEVLKNFPFSKYKFLALTIERPTKRLNKILFKNGYVFVKNHKVDSFYVHENLKNLSRIEKKPFSQIGRKKW